MYFAAIDFNTIVEINKLLKEKGFKASIHSVGGCASCGVELKLDNEETRDDIIKVINDFLKAKYIYIEKEPESDKYYQVLSMYEK